MRRTITALVLFAWMQVLPTATGFDQGSDPKLQQLILTGTDAELTRWLEQHQ